MSEPVFKKLDSIAEMLPNYLLVKQLSPHLSEEDYETMLNEMIPHNYFQVGAYLDDKCIAISGYWLATKLYCGKYLEIDNFVVDINHRNNNIGSKLLGWMEKEAVNEHCKLLILDAYVENFLAHRFYYRHGFHARGFHYLKKLE